MFQEAGNELTRFNSSEFVVLSGRFSWTDVFWTRRMNASRLNPEFSTPGRSSPSSWLPLGKYNIGSFMPDGRIACRRVLGRDAGRLQHDAVPAQVPLAMLRGSGLRRRPLQPTTTRHPAVADCLDRAGRLVGRPALRGALLPHLSGLPGESFCAFERTFSSC